MADSKQNVNDIVNIKTEQITNLSFDFTSQPLNIAQSQLSQCILAENSDEGPSDDKCKKCQVNTSEIKCDICKGMFCASCDGIPAYFLEMIAGIKQAPEGIGRILWQCRECKESPNRPVIDTDKDDCS